MLQLIGIVFEAILIIPVILREILYVLRRIAVQIEQIAPSIMSFLPSPSVVTEPKEKPMDEIDMIEYQKDMEKLFHKNQLIPRIKGEFTNPDLNLKQVMLDNGIDPNFGFNFMVQLSLHKRASISIMVGILRGHFKGRSNASQMTADAILKCIMADLAHWSIRDSVIVVRYDITKDVQDDLDRYQYPLPMIVPPVKIESNEDLGYYTSKGSVILKDNHHNGDLCLEHLNKMNHIPLSINHITSNMIKNQWRNLDKKKPDEEFSDYQKRVKAFEKYDRTAKDVLTHLAIAGNKLYLTHRYDKRGRVYCQGYHVNYQGNDWNKAVIEFAEGEVVNA